VGSLNDKVRQGWSKPSRIQIAWKRRAARKAESQIRTYHFPDHLEAHVRRHFPELGSASWELVERGLREWFVCCAWRGWALLGMPSRVVDEAWHEFILDSKRYSGFCDLAFGQYLHHTPDASMTTPMPQALASTVISWDRSDWGREEEAVLWDIDRRLEIERPYGISPAQLDAIRLAVPREVDGWLAGYGGGQVGGVDFAMVAPGTLGGWTAGGGAGCGVGGDSGGCGGGGCGGGN
jgi:hypothetical protein